MINFQEGKLEFFWSLLCQVSGELNHAPIAHNMNELKYPLENFQEGNLSLFKQSLNYDSDF
jgi:hypothetical protein